MYSRVYNGEGYDCIRSQAVVSRPCSMTKCSSGKELSSSTTFAAILVIAHT